MDIFSSNNWIADTTLKFTIYHRPDRTSPLPISAACCPAAAVWYSQCPFLCRVATGTWGISIHTLSNDVKCDAPAFVVRLSYCILATYRDWRFCFNSYYQLSNQQDTRWRWQLHVSELHVLMCSQQLQRSYRQSPSFRDPCHVPSAQPTCAARL